MLPGAIKAILGARKLKAPTKKNTVHIYFYCIFLVFGNFQSALKKYLVSYNFAPSQTILHEHEERLIKKHQYWKLAVEQKS